jgi:probable HAF family extracellular repeat protein
MERQKESAARSLLCFSTLFLMSTMAWCALPARWAGAQEYTAHEVTFDSSQCVIRAFADGRAAGWATGPSGASGPDQTEIHAFTWTEADGLTDIGIIGKTDPEGLVRNVRPFAVDGDRVAGSDDTGAGFHAFSWTQADGILDLGTLGGASSTSADVSGDEVVGVSKVASGDAHAFRWTPAASMVDLGTLPGDDTSTALAVDDGLVAGSSGPGGSSRPVVWNAAGQITDLTADLDDVNGSASYVRDGLVVGFYTTPEDASHFAWTPAGGRVDFEIEVLPGYDGIFVADQSGGQVLASLQIVGSLLGRDFGGLFGDEARPFSWTLAGGTVDLGTLGGEAEATHVSNGRVVGFYHVDPDQDPDFDPGNASTFLWTPSGGMVHVRSRSRPAGIDAAGRIAVVEDADIPEGARTRSWVLVPKVADADGDGVPDADDACPDSITGPTVVIDGCDSGVANTVLASGCTIADRVEECAASAVNHRRFVKCVAGLTKELIRAGAIPRKQRGALQRCAAQSHLPSRP